MAIKSLRQIATASLGTIAEVAPTYLKAAGISDNNVMHVEDKPYKDQYEQEHPDKVNVKIDFKSKQMTFNALDAYIHDYCVKGGCDFEAVGEKTGASAYGGVWRFTGANHLGFDFEWKESKAERYLQIIGEADLEAEVWNVINTAALTNVPLDLAALAIGAKGVDRTLYRKPYYKDIQSPVATSLVNGYDVVDWSFILKNITNKIAYNRSDTSYIQAMLELTVRKAATQDLVDIFAKDRYAAVKWEQRDSASVIKTYDFAEGVFGRVHIFDVDKDKREIKMRWQKNIPLFDIVINEAGNTFTVTA